MKNFLATVSLTALGLCSFANVSHAMDEDQNQQNHSIQVKQNQLKPIILEVSNTSNEERAIDLIPANSGTAYRVVLSPNGEEKSRQIYLFSNSSYVQYVSYDQGNCISSIGIPPSLIVQKIVLGDHFRPQRNNFVPVENNPSHMICSKPLQTLCEYFEEPYLKFKLFNSKDSESSLKDILTEVKNLISEMLIQEILKFDNIEDCRISPLTEHLKSSSNLS